MVYMITYGGQMVKTPLVDCDVPEAQMKLGLSRCRLNGKVRELLSVSTWSWVVVITTSVGVYLGTSEAEAESRVFPLPADVVVPLGPVGPGTRLFVIGPDDGEVSVSAQPLRVAL